MAILNRPFFLALCLVALAGGILRAAQPKPSAGTKPATRVRTDRYGDPLPEGVRMRFGTIRWQAHGEHVASTPDGQRYLLCDGREVSTLDSNTGRLLARIELQRPKGDLGHVNVDFSKDRKTILTIESDSNRVRFWDVASGKMLREFDAVAGAAVSFQWSPDGSLVAAADYNHRFYLWDAATGARHRFSGADLGQGDHTLWMVFSPDSKFLAVAVAERSIRIWNLSNGQMVHEFKVRPGCMGYTRDGKHMTCLVDNSHEIKFWNVATGKEEASLHVSANEPIDFFAESPDGKLLAVRGARRIYLWNWPEGKLLQTLNASAATWHAFTRDGKRLACFNGCALSMWDVVTGRELNPRHGHAANVERLVFSPNGRLLASIDRPLGNWNYQKTLILWDTATGNPVQSLEVPHGCGTPSFCADSKLLLIGDSQRGIRIWDFVTGKELPAVTAQNWDVEFHDTLNYGISLDRKRVGAIKHYDDESGQAWGQYWLWDLTSGNLVVQRLRRGCGFDGCFSPDCQTIALPLRERREDPYEHSLCIQDVTTGRDRFTLPSEYIVCLRFSADGKSVAASRHRRPASAEICIWEVATGKERLHFPTKGSHRFAWSANARFLATSDFETLYLWDGTTGKGISPIHLPERCFLNQFTFSPDSKTLAIGMNDTTILAWDVSRSLAGAGFPAKGLKQNEFQNLWSELAGSDAGQAYRAIWTLVAAPDKAVPFLKAQLRPVTEQDLAPIEQCIADLDSPQFRVRATADKALRRRRFEAEPNLREALRKTPSLEVRQRVEAIMANPIADEPCETLAQLRAIEVLEHIASTDAMQVLHILAKGAPRAHVTLEARASLQRLSGQPGSNGRK